MKKEIANKDLEKVQGGAKVHVASEQMHAAGWYLITETEQWTKTINGSTVVLDFTRDNPGALIDEEFLSNPDYFPIH